MSAATDVVLGVTGSIGAYRAADIVRRLAEAGLTTTCVLTKEAMQFVAPLTLQALSGRAVHADLFAPDYPGVIHTDLADTARVLVIAPATANVIAKLALGLADDLLTCIALATQAPILIAPAMNVHMYEHPATQAHLKTLAGRGCRFVGPVSGALACGYDAVGHVAEPEAIVEAVRALLSEGVRRKSSGPVKPRR
jgi:phosphopantothenoylcysteine decarboxylase/phosphopantothenate--cysteine ligase